MSLQAFMQATQGHIPPSLVGGWVLLERKHWFVFLMLLQQLLSLFTTWALVTSKLTLLVFLPIVGEVARFAVDYFLQQQVWEIKRLFRRLALDHFGHLPYVARKKTEMQPFAATIQQAAYVIETSLTWGIPTLIDGIVSLVSVIWAVCSFGYWFLLPIMALIYAIFWRMHLQMQTTTLKDLRQQRKLVEKNIDAISEFRLNELVLCRGNADTIEQLNLPKEELEMQFNQGWEMISSSIVFVALLVAATGLYPIFEPVRFFAAKVVFDRLTGATTMLAHFGNYLSSRGKDFDKFVEWYDNHKDLERDAPQLCIPKDGMTATVDVKLDDLRISTQTPLTIKLSDCVMLRGQSGCGKTQTLNALQGLIGGALLSNATAKNFTQQFEYCNQQTREWLPSSVISLRKMLSDECDTNLIRELVDVAGLRSKFPSPASYDEEMENFSGGERMRLAIIYTLWGCTRNNRSIIVLDEPEQGLDEECRTTLLKNVCQWAKRNSKALLVVFHGSALDVWNLRCDFDWTWKFSQSNMHTTIEQLPFSEFAQQERQKALLELR